MAANADNETLQLEIESLAYTYEGLEVVHGPSQTTLALQLAPRQLDGDHEAYVALKLVLAADSCHYPETPASVALEDVKGLSDTAESSIRAALHQEAANLAGEMMLGHLVESGLDLLTELNNPTGTCIFCLEDVETSSSGIGTGSAADGIPNPVVKESSSSSSGDGFTAIKLPCFHCFHRLCFAAWFQWQQRELRAAADEPVGHGDTRPAPLDVTVNCGATFRGLFAVRCPSCRCEVLPHALSHSLPSLLGSYSSTFGGENGEKNQSRAEWGAAHPSTREALPEPALRQLQDLQRRFSEVLEVQRRCNGLVQTSVAVSVAELQDIATAAMATTAGATGAAAAVAVEIRTTTAGPPPAAAAVGAEGGSNGGGKERRKEKEKERRQHGGREEGGGQRGGGRQRQQRGRGRGGGGGGRGTGGGERPPRQRGRGGAKGEQ